jgi:hypothetical protein
VDLEILPTDFEMPERPCEREIRDEQYRSRRESKEQYGRSDRAQKFYGISREQCTEHSAVPSDQIRKR